MESLELCCVAPHPPILIPEVGGPEVKHVQKSTQALKILGSEIERINPATLIVISPHTPIYSNAFSIIEESNLVGSFSQFGASSVRIESVLDIELAEALKEESNARDIPMVMQRGGSTIGNRETLDHGVLVPLYFLAPASYRLVCLSISLLDYWSHYQLGIAIREVVERMKRKTVFIASGDLSHRLTPGAPAGFNPCGEKFDKLIVDIMETGLFSELFALDSLLVEEAGECGLRSVFALAGIFDGYDVLSEVLSYEGPFGVGYMVAKVLPGKRSEGRKISRP